MGGKSKSVTVGYKHYLGEHMVLCHGPIDYVSRIRVDERIAWSGEENGGQINVQAAELFGGESREGGVSGLVDIEMGGSAQGQNSYLVSILGSDVPAYRGVVSAILRQCYLGNNPYLKKWDFRGSRIHVRQDGVSQWYDDVSEIVGIAPVAPTSTHTINLSATANAATGPSGGLSVGVELTGLNATDVLVIKPNLAGPNVAWSPWGSPSPVGGMSGSVYRWSVIRNGDSGNVVDMGVSGTYDGYTAARAAFMSARPNGQQLRGAGSYEFYIEDSPTGDNSGGLSLTVEVYPGASIDMNPAHIIRECLTDPDWGMGYADSDIDATSFEAAADTLYNEGLGMSLLWDRQNTIDSFIQEIVRHIDAALYVDRKTGKFVLKLIRADYDPEELIILDESNISKVTNPARATFGELVNSVTVNYWDANTGKDASLTVQDTALVQMQGAVINTTLQYPGFTYSTPAALAAQRDLRVLSAPFLSCTIYTDSTGKDLNIGDTFKFKWGRWQIEEMIMRVTGMAFGDGKTTQVRITCTQDVYSTPAVSVIVPGGTEWVDPSAPPGPFDHELAIEAPYLELVQTLGEGDTNSALAGNNSLGYVMGAAARPASAINGRMWTDSGGGYGDVGGFDFCPFAELDQDIGKTDATFDYTGGIDLSEVELGTWCQIDDELMRVDAIDTGAGTITVGRGVLDTVPEAHLQGAGIFFWDQYNTYDPTEYVEGEEIDVKLQPTSGAGVVDLAAVTPQTVEIVGRPYRPYPPGNLTVEGLSYSPGPFSDELSIAWAHRDRLQQTSGTLADHFDGDIGPEEGTTYQLLGYVDDFLSHTEDDIAGTSTTWTPVTGGTVRIEVRSKRGEFYSWQAANHEFEYGDLPQDPYWGNVVYLMYGEGADGSTTFNDRSQYAAPCIAGGVAQVDTGIAVGTVPSILFGADGSYVRRDHGDELNITGADGPDFCMEAYVYCTNLTAGINQIFGRRRNSDNYILQIDASGNLNFSTFSGTTGTTRLSVPSGMSNNTVHHVCVIRSGTTYYGFVDGVLVGSNTQASGAGISTTQLFLGESENDQASRYWRGNINWARITMGVPRYSLAGFTPPSLPLATGRPDPVATPSATFANVVLLCGFNGTDGATAFTDESTYARTATFVANAQLDTAQSKFGTASLLLDGTGDHVTFPDATELKLPTGGSDAFCMEAWVRPTGGTHKANATIFDKRPSSSAQEFTLELVSGVPAWSLYSGGNSIMSIVSPAGAIPLDDWTHIAVTGSGPFYRLFVNGIMVAVGTRRAAAATNTQVFRIGRNGFSTSRDFNGWIDEVRYVRGEAVYTNDFEVPTSAFPRS